MGLGGKVAFGGDVVLGPWIPVGLSDDFGAPFELAVEIAPGFALLPSTDFTVEGGRPARSACR